MKMGFGIKSDENGNKTRLKVRLVPKGFLFRSFLSGESLHNNMTVHDNLCFPWMALENSGCEICFLTAKNIRRN